MKSANIYVEEIDDLEAAVEELAEQLERKLILETHTCGLLFCDSDTIVEELLPLLKERFNFPIMGCTAVAVLTKEEGYNDTGISMLVLTAEDCQFSVGITEPMEKESYVESIGRLYTSLSKELPEKEKLIICFGPQDSEIVGDNFIEALNEISGNVPVIGGIASDHFTLKDSIVFADDKASHMSLGMILVSGNIRPRFIQEFSVTDSVNALQKVIKSSQNVVQELDSGNFIDVLRNCGLRADETDGYIEFISTVFEAELEMPDGERITVLRDLGKINLEDKSASFLGNVPPGSKMRLCLMNKNAIKDSVKSAFTNMLEEIKNEDGYEYSTFLCISCAGRFLLLTTDPDAEGKAYANLLPDTINLCGMYSYGEFCPVKGGMGNLYNIFHNKTFTIVAF